jgi:hypothetical protein
MGSIVTSTVAEKRPNGPDLFQHAISQQDRLRAKDRDEKEHRAQGHDKTFHEVFRHFSESHKAALDTRIPYDEWSIDEESVACVRKNQDVFRGFK